MNGTHLRGAGLWLTMVASSAVVGCGAPDLQHMAPTVDKPTAIAFLVDKPGGWSRAQVQDLAARYNVVMQVAECNASSLVQRLNSSLNKSNIGFVLVVEQGPISDELMQTASSHMQQRFEFVGSSANASSGANVRQVIPDPLSSAYALGSLTGSLAVTANTTSVGWLQGTTGGQASDVTAQRAALCGLYAANPNVATITPVVTNAAAGSSTPMPHLIIAAGTLSEADLMVLRNQGAMTVALHTPSAPTTVSATSVVGFPDTVHDTAVDSDVKAFVDSQWKPGVNRTRDSSLIVQNAALVPPSVKTTVEGTITGLQNTQVDPNALWAAIPQNVRMAWSAATGIAP